MKTSLKSLRSNFDKAMKYFNLSKEEIDAAWSSAIADPIKAHQCYSAIVRSL